MEDTVLTCTLLVLSTEKSEDIRSFPKWRKNQRLKVVYTVGLKLFFSQSPLDVRVVWFPSSATRSPTTVRNILIGRPEKTGQPPLLGTTVDGGGIPGAAQKWAGVRVDVRPLSPGRQKVFRGDEASVSW